MAGCSTGDAECRTLPLGTVLRWQRHFSGGLRGTDLAFEDLSLSSRGAGAGVLVAEQGWLPPALSPPRRFPRCSPEVAVLGQLGCDGSSRQGPCSNTTVTAECLFPRLSCGAAKNQQLFGAVFRLPPPSSAHQELGTSRAIPVPGRGCSRRLGGDAGAWPSPRVMPGTCPRPPGLPTRVWDLGPSAPKSDHRQQACFHGNRTVTQDFGTSWKTQL